MAERRMFAKTIIDSDAFLDMPLSTQALYFHLSMRADDDGFINNPRKIQRMIGCGDDDLKLLIAKNFILPFDSGVVVIKHWKIHNYIRNDRYKETVYQEEKAMLDTKDNKAYTISAPKPLGIPNDNQWDTQDRIGKDSIGKSKDSIEIEREDASDSPNPPPPHKPTKPKPVKHKFGEYKNVLLTDEEVEKLQNEFGDLADKAITHLDEYIEMKGYKAKSHYLAIRKWVIDAVKERMYQEKKNSIPTYPAKAKSGNNVFLGILESEMEV